MGFISGLINGAESFFGMKKPPQPAPVPQPRPQPQPQIRVAQQPMPTPSVRVAGPAYTAPPPQPSFIDQAVKAVQATPGVAFNIGKGIVDNTISTVGGALNPMPIIHQWEAHPTLLHGAGDQQKGAQAQKELQATNPIFRAGQDYSQAAQGKDVGANLLKGTGETVNLIASSMPLTGFGGATPELSAAVKLAAAKAGITSAELASRVSAVQLARGLVTGAAVPGLAGKVIGSATGNAAYGGVVGAAGGAQTGDIKNVASGAGAGIVTGAGLGTAGELGIAGIKAAVKGVQTALKPTAVHADNGVMPPERTAPQSKELPQSQPAKPVQSAKPDAQTTAPALHPPVSELPKSSESSLPATVQQDAKPVKLDTAEFLKQISRAPKFGGTFDTFKTDLQKLGGTHRANIRLLDPRTKEDISGISEADKQAIYAHSENNSLKLTDAQQKIYDEHVAPVKKFLAEAAGHEYDPNFQSRIADSNKGRSYNSKFGQHIEGTRAHADAGATRQTSDMHKGAKMAVITDPKTGEERVVHIGSAKDEFGRSKGSPRVSSDGKDLGILNKKLPDQVKDFHDPKLRAALNDIAEKTGATKEDVVKIKGHGSAAGVYYPGRQHIQRVASSPEDTLLHEIGHHVDHKYNLQETMFGGKRPVSDMIIRRQIEKAKVEGNDDLVATLKEQQMINRELRKLADERDPQLNLRKALGRPPSAYLRSGPEKMAAMFQAHLHAPDLFERVAPTAYKRFSEFLHSHEDTMPIVDIANQKSLHLGAKNVGDTKLPGEFIDKSGKHWNLRRASTTEVENATKRSVEISGKGTVTKPGVTYFHDAVGVNSVRAVNEANANHARTLADNFKSSPSFHDHAMKTTGEGKVPPSWKTVKSSYFTGYSFDPETAKMIDDQLGGGHEAPTTVLSHVVGAANNFGIQAAVFNPLIHGQNLVAQAHIAAGNIPGIGGAVDLDRALATALTGGPAKEEMIQHLLRGGGHYEDYGASHETLISKALAGTKLAGANKINAGWMADIDLTTRAALFDASKRGGMTDEAAIKNMNTFMGDKSQVDATTHAISMFYHYFVKTLGGAVVQQVRHPIANAGATVNTALLAATIYGVNKAWQDYTGNPNANVRVPGELGLINDAIKAPQQVIHGHIPSAITSHISPFANTAINQISGHNSFTGANLDSPGARAKDALGTLFSPSQQIGAVAGGKSSLLEKLLSQGFGVNTPHAPGAPAAPSNQIPFMNVAGAKPAEGADKTGYTQQQNYHQAIDAGRQSLAGDQHVQDMFNGYFSKSYNGKGQSIQLSPAERIATAKDLIGNQKLLNAVQKTQLAQKSHDPMWDLNPDQLHTFLEYQSAPSGDPARTNLTYTNGWLRGFINGRTDYYASQTKKGNSVAAAGTPTYPTFSPQTTQDLAIFDKLTPEVQSNWLKKNTDLSAAFTKISEYTNAMRKAEGAPELKTSPHPSADVQKYMDAYTAADKPGRASMRTSNPGMYKQMAAFFDANDIQTINKQGAVDLLKGSPDTTQKQTKAISGLSRDIYQSPTQADGKPGAYNIIPAGWMDGLTNSSGGSGGGSKFAPKPSTTPSSQGAVFSLMKGLSKSPKYGVKKVAVPKTASLKRISKPGRVSLPKYKAPKVAKSQMLKESKRGHFS